MTFLESVVIAIFEDYHLPITDCDWSLGGGSPVKNPMQSGFKVKTFDRWRLSNFAILTCIWHLLESLTSVLSGFVSYKDIPTR